MVEHIPVKGMMVTTSLTKSVGFPTGLSTPSIPPQAENAIVHMYYRI